MGHFSLKHSGELNDWYAAIRAENDIISLLNIMTIESFLGETELDCCILLSMTKKFYCLIGSFPVLQTNNCSTKHGNSCSFSTGLQVDIIVIRRREEHQHVSRSFSVNCERNGRAYSLIIPGQCFACFQEAGNLSLCQWRIRVRWYPDSVCSSKLVSHVAERYNWSKLTAREVTHAPYCCPSGFVFCCLLFTLLHTKRLQLWNK